MRLRNNIKMDNFKNDSKNKKITLESKYIALINSLSFSIKELYLNVTKIIKALKSNILEQNNYIITSRCLINEINNKKIIPEGFQNLIRNIEGINITNKYMMKNISNFEENTSSFFSTSKMIFKKMKELKNSNLNMIIQQKNIKHQNNISNILFSELNNNIEPESYTSKINKIKIRKDKKFEINRNDIISLSKKLLTGKNKKKYLNHSQDEITTDLFSNKMKKKNLFFDRTPNKNKNISWSKDKLNPIYKNLDFYFSSNKRRNNDSIISQRYHKMNKTSNKNKRIFKTYKLDSLSEQKIDIINIIEFVENMIDYFYLLIISQNNMINDSNKINKEDQINMKLKQTLIQLNYSIFIISDFFNGKIHLKRKLNYIIQQNGNFEYKLKNLISNLRNKDKEMISISKTNRGKIFETNIDKLINSKEVDYIKLIKKLKNDNNNLANINQNIISENKLLLNQLSLFEITENDFINCNNKNEKNNNNINLKLASLIRENKEYKSQINNMKKDNETLHKIIQKIKNNPDNRKNSSYFLNNSQISNIINYNTDINNNNNINKKKEESENLKFLQKENELLKVKLNEKDENSNKNRVNEEIEKLKNKCKSYMDIINEKESIIKTLNLNLNDLKIKFNDNKNNYISLKENIKKDKEQNENEIKKLELLIEEKNNDIKKLTDDEKDKSNKLNEQLKLIDKLENLNKKTEKEKNDIIKKLEQKTKEINELESMINFLNEKLKNSGKNQVKEIINNDIVNKRLSTPSFKSPEEEIDEINNIKQENELLLKKIVKYESILKINQNKENENNENINDIENINEKSNKNILIQNIIKKPNNEIGNNYLSTISSMKINKLYSPNEFIILSDSSYNHLKWYLMKKISQGEEENDDIDSYENLSWVPITNIIDLEKFEYEELGNSTEIFNLIKKLEEKEKIISKLSYKLEKLEKESPEHNLTLNIKNKNNLNNINDNIFEDKLKTLKSGEGLISIEKYNILLDKLNKVEENFEKIQKENMELIKYKKLYLDSKEDANNPINKINIRISDEDKKKENSNTNDEIDYYKKKCEELQTLLNVFKESFKNILSKLVIPKKEKGEIKQILKLFDFSKEETFIILGEKK